MPEQLNANPAPTPSPARLIAQLRLSAEKAGIPVSLADAMAEQPAMNVERFERCMPGVELLRTLAEHHDFRREDVERLSRSLVSDHYRNDDADADALRKEARNLVMAELERKDPLEGRTYEPATVNHSWERGGGLRARLADGLQARIDPSHNPTLGREFAGLELGALCMEIARGRGERVGTRAEAIRMATGGGYHTTSDFAMITSDAMSNTVARRFEQRVPDLARASREIPRVDYHEGKSLTLSASGVPQEIEEAGEIQFTTMDEKGETLPTLRDFGAGFNLTNRAIANDHVGLLAQAGDRMVQGAVERMRKVLLEPLQANAGAGQTMADGSPMFSSARGNLGVAAEISVTSLSAARVALRKAKGLQGEIYAIKPWALVVPAELETTAQQVVAEIMATNFSDANPFSGTLEIIVEPGLEDPLAWYLIADPQQHDGLAHAFLEGQRTPRVESRPAWETLGVQFRLVWALDAKFIETAAWFRNPGAPAN